MPGQNSRNHHSRRRGAFCENSAKQMIRVVCESIIVSAVGEAEGTTFARNPRRRDTNFKEL